MLKTIIQNKNVNRLLRFEAMAFGKAVLAHAKTHAVREAELHQFNFVAASVYAPVAAAQNRHTLPFRKKFLSEPDDHWRLAGAADGKIAHADDRSFQPPLSQPTLRVEPSPHAHDSTIRHRQRPEQRTHER